MSNLFPVFAVSGSGLDVYKQWLNAVSDNVANADDTSSTSGPAFQARYIVAQDVPGGPDGTGAGVRVAGVAYGSAAGIEVYAPNDPHADKQGMVRKPDIDMGEQVTAMMIAERGYEANLAVVNRAESAYQAALSITPGHG
ncbi:MAG TPA: flagellar basal body rod C-terminal domain-containing protein [Acidimicrobiales bacterium]|nr:flagellar basal body rod C-terminal domain-containing protein [Acidimicrobiales bacterium]